MEAAVGRVVVFTLALRAHLEGAHRGVGAVVRKLPQNREARAAIGAVDKGVKIAPVARVEQLRHASIASCQVGGHESRLQRRHVVRKMNLEAFVTLRLNFLDVDFRHLSCRRRFLGNAYDEAVKFVWVALRADENALDGVEHPAVQAMLMGQPVHERPEAYALDDALNLNMQSFHVRSPYICAKVWRIALASARKVIAELSGRCR